MSNQSSWIGVDLDGTLAVYDGWKGIEHIGEPIQSIVDYVKQLLAYGIEVRIFTARMQEPEAGFYIERWCQEHIGQVLPVTDRKDFGMTMLIDDRAYSVWANTGQCSTLGGLPLVKDVFISHNWHWSTENPDSPTYAGVPCQ